MQKANSRTRLSLVVPFLNEEDCLPIFLKRIGDLFRLPDFSEVSVELLFVDDGSTDQSVNELFRNCEALLHQSFVDRAVLIKFSRNFGKEAAISAGLENATGDVVIPIDCDLQDPPELIIELLRFWREGFEIVVPVRSSREFESSITSYMARAFYKLFSYMSKITLVDGAGDFRLLDRKVVDTLISLPERSRFMKGLYSWVGYKTHYFLYQREARIMGRSRFNLKRLFSLALTGLVSFSSYPLYLAFILGMLIAFLGFLFGCWVVFDALMHGNPVSGYPSVLSFIILLGGLNILSIGLVGIYIAQLFVEIKNRPNHVIRGRYELIGNG